MAGRGKTRWLRNGFGVLEVAGDGSERHDFGCCAVKKESGMVKVLGGRD